MAYLCGVPKVTGGASVSSPSHPRDAPRSWWPNSPSSRGWARCTTVMLAAGPGFLRRKENSRPKQPKVEILRKGAKMASQQEMFLDASLGNDFRIQEYEKFYFSKTCLIFLDELKLR